MLFKFLIILLNLIIIIDASKDEFIENLFIKPLSTGYVYAHFEFKTLFNKKLISLNYENHFDLFPVEIAKLITEKRIEELKFSLTKSTWKTKEWSYPFRDATPGVELNVWFSESNSIPDKNWKELTNYLSGKFCASISSIDKTTSTSPKFILQPKFNDKNLTNNYYASLPDETVCTENLTPWKKLLPCYSKSGLSSLLNSVFILNSNYFSLSTDLEQFCLTPKCDERGITLKQTVSIVFNPVQKNQGKTQSWSLIKLFGLAVRKPCWLAKESKILIDITSNSTDNSNILTPAYQNVIERKELINDNRKYAVYDLNEFFKQNPNATKFNVASIYSNQFNYQLNNKQNEVPLYTNRYFIDNGYFDGKIECKLINNLDRSIDVIYFESLPWYLRFYLHTLKIENQKLNDNKLISSSSYSILNYQPGKYKERQYHLELKINLPPNSITKISFDVDKVFLKWTDYPPDANRGIYISSSIIEIDLNEQNNHNKLRLTTQPLLISLPTPDFSMPYNVICLVSTVISLCFAPIHNFTTRLIDIIKINKK